MSARNNAGRHVRQRKLNTKQGLRVLRESELEDGVDDETQRNIPQVETGVEKGEEVEFHLQAVISAANAAALGAKTQQSYIPTPETVKAKGVNYDELYPKVFSQPATYIRFSATVEESVGVPYCMNDDDYAFLAKLNDGKDVDGRDRKDKLSQCTEDTFEEVMNFFEETSARVLSFTALESTPILSLEEMEQSSEETLSPDAQSWLKVIYAFWVLRKTNRPRMPTIKVRVLDTTSEADDADPYVCFRRREVRQTRKTRGRDAQVVDKLKKLRLELEQARELVQLVVQREQLNKENLEISRKVFEERRKLKEVKVTKNILGEKGDDEDLLVNQKPISKPKRQADAGQPRPSTIRIRSSGERAAPDTDLELLSDRQAEAETYVNNNIETRKEQHKKWNHHWIDRTWAPLTPPPEDVEHTSKWGSLVFDEVGYPTPPPSLPSISRQASEAKDDDVEMLDAPIEEVAPRPSSPHVFGDPGSGDPTLKSQHQPLRELDFNVFHIPGAWPLDHDESSSRSKRDASSACRLRYGRGGRCFLESRKRKAPGYISRGVVSDSESEDDEVPVFFPISERITFDYRCALNSRTRPDVVAADRKTATAGESVPNHPPKPTNTAAPSGPT